jgi:hypothetical protein
MNLIKACVEISQLTHFVQLIYANKKERKWETYVCMHEHFRLKQDNFHLLLKHF